MRKIKHKDIAFFVLLQFFSATAFGMPSDDETTFPSVSQKFNFSALNHGKEDPESYTLICLNSTLIPASHKPQDLKYRKDLSPIKTWLRSTVLDEVDVEEEQKEQKEQKRLSVVEINPSGENPYYIVQLHLRSYPSASEQFTARLLGTSIDEDRDLRFSASMLIFPQLNTTHALAYLFGEWTQLLNPYSVIHDWGLRIAATDCIFSDQNIKTLLGKNNFDPNPTSRKETKQRLAPLESFALEVGTEGLLSLTILPQYAISTACKRLVVGRDWYRFFLPYAQEGNKADTLGSLMRMARYLYGIFQNNPRVHSKLRYYIDDEIRDVKTRQALNGRLLEILQTKGAKLSVFPVNDVWKLYGKNISFSFGKNRKKKYLLDALEGEEVTLESPISIDKKRKGTFNEPLDHLIYTLPIELEGMFYRFDRGRWFKVEPSRFEAIVRKLRAPSVKTSMEALVPYTLEDAVGSGGLYQEDRYNRRVIAVLTDTKQKGLLLDRLNIYLGGQGNKFEFGDLLLYDDKGSYYIVHVKRKEAGDIDHHRSQVERTAEYLATELKKENAHDLLLQACVNGLYTKHDVSTNKLKTGQGKRLTHGDVFKKLFAEKKRGPKETWDSFLKKKILSNTTEQAKTAFGKFKILLRSLDLNFFEPHQAELIVAFDALAECYTKKVLPQKEIEDFLEAVKQLINLRAVLFPSGTLTSAMRKKITIVMAVIDDRKIEGIRDKIKILEKLKKDKKPSSEITQAEQEIETLKTQNRSKETELFKKQHLWGLDHTQQRVQKCGFRFQLVVVNENTERENWDAFGVVKPDPIQIEESDSSEPYETESSTQESSEKVKKPKKKAIASASKGKKGFDNLKKEKDIKGYEYTSTDINRLLHVPLSQNVAKEDYDRFSLSDAPVDDASDSLDIVHCFKGKKYVLPPILAHKDDHEYKGPYEVLIDFLADTFFPHPQIMASPPEELIIPFNPGGHWVTLRILISPQTTQDIEVRYIDSLRGNFVKTPLIFLAFLRGKYAQRKVKFNFQVKRIQPDHVSCGALTVNNIRSLFKGEELPDNEVVTLEQIIQMKFNHQNYLKNRGLDFDF